MHIPDGMVSGPVNVAAFAVAAAVCGRAAARAAKTLQEDHAPLLGVTAAFIFAAQMLNFPVFAGTSGHFLGALFAAIALGPLNACLVMTVVLTLQCLLFADGGLTALGTNIFNMGIVGGIGGYAVFRSLQALLPQTRTGFLTSAALASWSSVVLASAACAGELAFSGTIPLQAALPAMAGIHAIIGIGEAIITVAILSTVMASRPHLIASWRQGLVAPPLEEAYE